MNVNVLLSPLNADELYFNERVTVVIDVLRATTTIATALANGAKEVIPVNSIEFAMKVSRSSFGGHTLLAGERNSVKIDGFSLGNSPLEYTEEAVSGKSIILFTTNGSKAVVKAKFSEQLYICSFNNLEAIASHLAKQGKDVVILCAGSHGMFCIEDTICAGRLIKSLIEKRGETFLSDSARASIVLSESYGGDVYEILAGSEHGRDLVEKGFAEDLSYCSLTGNIDIIPVYKEGCIKAYTEKAAEES